MKLPLYFDGMFKQRVYVVPSRQLVIVRVGAQAKGWDDSFLPNAILRGLGDGRTPEMGVDKDPIPRPAVGKK